MSTQVFKDIPLTDAQINSNYALKQLNILNTAQVLTNADNSAQLNALNAINTSVADVTTTNVVYGKENVLADVADHSNIVIGNKKTHTAGANVTKPLSATQNAVVIGSGQFPQGANAIPNNAIMIGHGCAPSGAIGRIAFGDTCEAVHGSFAMPNASVPQAYIKIEYNGVLYYIPAFTTAPN
jgi:hypothetical protein